jgi:hypothetical protein
MSSTWHNRTTPRQTTSGWPNCRANPLFLTGQATVRAFLHFDFEYLLADPGLVFQGRRSGLVHNDPKYRQMW